jgi:hypothetical protein
MPSTDDPDNLPADAGSTDKEGRVTCPYCGESNTLTLDPSSGTSQDYIEDCQVCCHSMRIIVSYLPSGNADVHAESIDDE